LSASKSETVDVDEDEDEDRFPEATPMISRFSSVKASMRSVPSPPEKVILMDLLANVHPSPCSQYLKRAAVAAKVRCLLMFQETNKQTETNTDRQMISQSSKVRFKHNDS